MMEENLTKNGQNNKEVVETENKKGVFVFLGNDGKRYRMSLQEKGFCEDYLEFSGNGTEAAYENYECKNMKVAAAIAYENLRKPHIIAYIDSKLEEYGFNDENVKKQHLFTLQQFADLAQKNKAIDMFYKLKGSYAPEKSLVGILNISRILDNLDDGPEIIRQTVEGKPLIQDQGQEQKPDTVSPQ